MVEFIQHWGTNDTTGDVKQYYHQLINHSQFQSVRHFLSGSYVENPGNRAANLQSFGVSDNVLDIDRMIYRTSLYAFSRGRVVGAEEYTGEVIRIYTQDVHVGYARLINEKSNTELLSSQIREQKIGEEDHGPAAKYDSRQQWIDERSNFSLSVPIVDGQTTETERIFTFNDLVMAVHCPYWPVEAAGWITRRRPSGLPLRSTIKAVVKYGCDFVQVSHNRRNNDGEWRFSFSKAELIIIRHWTHSQT